MTKKENANSAERNSLLISIQKQNAALDHAQTGCAVQKVEYVGKEDVYNMEVEGQHNFAVNGGYISHNCIDAIRYALEPYHLKKDNSKDIKQKIRAARALL